MSVTSSVIFSLLLLTV